MPNTGLKMTALRDRTQGHPHARMANDMAEGLLSHQIKNIGYIAWGNPVELAERAWLKTNDD